VHFQYPLGTVNAIPCSVAGALSDRPLLLGRLFLIPPNSHKNHRTVTATTFEWPQPRSIPPCQKTTCPIPGKLFSDFATFQTDLCRLRVACVVNGVYFSQPRRQIFGPRNEPSELGHFRFWCLQLKWTVVLSHPFRKVREKGGAPRVLLTLNLKML